MDKTNEQIEQEYKAIHADFKPEFGNQRHIDIAQTAGEIAKLEQELSKKKSAAKGIEVLKKTIINKKKNVIFWLGQK